MKFGEVTPRTLYLSLITVLMVALIALGSSHVRQEKEMKQLKEILHEQRYQLNVCTYENKLCKTLLRGPND